LIDNKSLALDFVPRLLPLAFHCHVPLLPRRS